MKLGLNLLPVELKKKEKGEFFLEKFWIVFLLGNLLILGASYFGLHYLNQDALSNLEILERGIETKKEKALPYESLEKQSQGLIFREILIEKLEKKQEFSGKTFNYCKESIPQGTKLVSYHYERNKIILLCQSENQDEIIEMRNNLVACQHFSDIRIENVLKKKSEVPTGGDAENKNNNNKAYWEFAIGLAIEKKLFE